MTFYITLTTESMKVGRKVATRQKGMQFFKPTGLGICLFILQQVLHPWAGILHFSCTCSLASMRRNSPFAAGVSSNISTTPFIFKKQSRISYLNNPAPMVSGLYRHHVILYPTDLASGQFVHTTEAPCAGVAYTE